MEIEKIKKCIEPTNFDLTLRCICWLNQNLVLQHVNRLSVQEMQQSTDATRFGAAKLKKHVTSQNAHIPCVLSVECYLAESAEKQSNAKQSTEISPTTYRTTTEL